MTLANKSLLFFLALVAIVVGVQLFTAGFIGEMMTTNSRKTHEYLIADTIGLSIGNEDVKNTTFKFPTSNL